MADNPIKYRDFIEPDSSITTLIAQLEAAGAAHEELFKKLQKDAAKTEDALKKVNGATNEGQEAIAKEIPKVDELAKAQDRLTKARTEDAKKLVKLKALLQEQNVVNKLTIKLNASQVGSYNRLSAQYSLNKIELNKMTDAQRSASTHGKDLEAATKRIFEQMNKAQKATGKFTLQVGNYKIATKETNRELRALNGTYQNNIKELRRLAEAQEMGSAKGKKLLADTRALRKEMAQMKTAQAQAAKSTGLMSKAAAGLGGTLKSLAGMYVGLAGATKLWSNFTDTVIGFEKQMSSLKAISGATGSEFDQLEDNAKRLGATTSKTATEVAALSTEYAKLGFTTDEILNATEATILLSEATGEDVAMAAQVAGATIRGFGKDASETGAVVDLMAASFTTSGLNLERFAESMKLIAPVARAAKVPIGLVTASLAALADANIHGSIAGTAMRRILSEFDASGKPYGEQLDALAAKGITLADANDEVGRRAMTALLVLTENTDKIKDLTVAYDESAGAAKAMADVQRDNVAGALELAGSAWAGFILAITKGGNIMRSTIDIAASLFTWMTKHATVIKGLAKFLVLGAVAWGAYRLSIMATLAAKRLNIGATIATVASEGLLTVATRLATGAMLALNTAVKANPLGLIVSLATTAATAVLMFSSNTAEAANSQGDLNSALEETNDLIGKKIYNDFLVGLGKVKREIITLPNGVKALGTSFDETIDVVKALAGRVKDLKQSDLANLSDFFGAEILKTQRGLDDLEPGSVIEKLELAKIEEYKALLGAVSGEIERIAKLKKVGKAPAVTIDPAAAAKIRDLELGIMAEGKAKELATLAKNFEAKKVLFEKYGVDTKGLEEWRLAQIQKIEDKFQKKADKAAADKKAKDKIAAKKEISDAKIVSDAKVKAIEEQAKLANSEIDLLTVTEAEKTRLRLQAEKDRIRAILALNKAGGLELSKAQVKIMQNQIKKLGQTMVASTDDDIDLYSMAGINLDDDKKEAINESTEFALEQMHSFLDAKVRAADVAVAASEREVDSARNRVDAEIEARNNGFASNVSMAQKELNMAKKNQQKSLKEQEKAQKAQLVLDSITQASSLITASAKIWGQLGFPWAIPALAVMWGSFAFSKIQAFQSTKTKKFEKGGMGTIEGGSHASGNDVHFGNAADGTELRAEGGEGWAVFNKAKTRKYKNVLPGIVNSINKGTFEKRFMGSYNTEGLSVNVQSHGANLGALEKDVAGIRKQGERRYFVDGQGRVVETYKNLKRTYNA